MLTLKLSTDGTLKAALPHPATGRPRAPKRARDTNQLAKFVVDVATGEDRTPRLRQRNMAKIPSQSRVAAGGAN